MTQVVPYSYVEFYSSHTSFPTSSWSVTFKDNDPLPIFEDGDLILVTIFGSAVSGIGAPSGWSEAAVNSYVYSGLGGETFTFATYYTWWDSGTMDASSTVWSMSGSTSAYFGPQSVRIGFRGVTPESFLTRYTNVDQGDATWTITDSQTGITLTPSGGAGTNPADMFIVADFWGADNEDWWTGLLGQGWAVLVGDDVPDSLKVDAVEASTTFWDFGGSFGNFWADDSHGYYAAFPIQLSSPDLSPPYVPAGGLRICKVF